MGRAVPSSTLPDCSARRMPARAVFSSQRCQALASARSRSELAAAAVRSRPPGSTTVTIQLSARSGTISVASERRVKPYSSETASSWLTSDRKAMRRRAASDWAACASARSPATSSCSATSTPTCDSGHFTLDTVVYASDCPSSAGAATARVPCSVSHGHTSRSNRKVNSSPMNAVSNAITPAMIASSASRTSATRRLRND